MALAIVFAVIVVATARAQAVPAVSRLRLFPQASHTLDSLATESRESRREVVACILAYSVADSSLTITKIGVAVADSTDSLTVYAHLDLCPTGTPTIHSHVAENSMLGPSPIDLATNARRGVWGLLLIVKDNGWFVMVF